MPTAYNYNFDQCNVQQITTFYRFIIKILIFFNNKLNSSASQPKYIAHRNSDSSMKSTIVIIFILAIYQTLYRVHAMCTNGIAGCAQCNINSVQCLYCQNHYRMLPNLTCEPCTQPSCHKCNSSPNICTVAEEGSGVINYEPQPCLVADCQQCNDNTLECRVCNPGFRLSDPTTCQLCHVARCEQCFENAAQCQRCQIRFFLFNNVCQVNTITTCVRSFLFATCQQCVQRSSFQASSASCVPCSDLICRVCIQRPQTCQVCQDLYGVNLITGQCQLCNDSKCVSCNGNYLFCTQCIFQLHLGPDLNGRCSPCNDQSCQLCHKNAFTCQRCLDLKGVDEAGQCSWCADPNCLICSRNYTICLQCAINYGVSSSGQCQGCQDANCLDCSISFQSCIKCKPFYGFKTGSSCVSCQIMNCEVCDNSSILCEACLYGYGVNSLGNCQACGLNSYNCLQCNPSNSNECVNCSIGRFLHYPDKSCLLCPIFCQSCYQNNSLVICLQCLDNITGTYYIMQSDNCTQILCGDLQIGVLQQCDNLKGRAYDGCSDICLVQDGFFCQNMPNIRETLCSYTQVLQMNLITFERKYDQNQNPLNQYSIKISIFPPLFIFTVLSLEDLKNLFTIKPQELIIIDQFYDGLLGVLQFTGQIKQTLLKNTQVQIRFNPQAMIYYQFLFSPNCSLKFQIKKTFYYISSSDITLSNIVLYICYALVALFWLAFLLGVLLKRLAGLEAMFVLQVAYMSFFLLPSNMLITFEQTHPLRFSAGYNHAFAAEQMESQIKQQVHYNIFKFSSKLLMNNINLSLLLQLIPLALVIVSYYRLKKNTKNLKIQKLQQQNQSKDYKIVLKLIGQHQYCLQLLMNSSMVLLMCFTLCLTMFIKYGDVTNVPSLVIASAQLLILVSTFVKFLWDPTPFDYFRFSFKLNQLAMKHYCLYIIMFIGLTVLLVIFDDLPYICISLPACILLYTIIFRPYNETSQNIRAICNMLAIIATLFFRVLVKYLVQQKQLNGSLPSMYFIINVLVVLPLIWVIGITSMLYGWYKQWRAQYEQQKNRKHREVEVQKYRNKVLGQLVKIDPNKQLQSINIDNTFRQFMNPDVSLLKVTNKLKQMRKFENKQEMYINNKKWKKQYELEDMEELKKIELMNKKIHSQRKIHHVFNSSNYMSNKLMQLKEQYPSKQGQEIEKQAQHQKGIQDYRSVHKNSSTLNYQTHKQMMKNQMIPNKGKKRNYMDRDEDLYRSIFKYNTLSVNSQEECEDKNGDEEPKQTVVENIPKQIQKHITAAVVKSEQKYINLQAAINKTKQIMEQELEKQIMQQYQKIDMHQ